MRGEGWGRVSQAIMRPFKVLSKVVPQGQVSADHPADPVPAHQRPSTEGKRRPRPFLLSLLHRRLGEAEVQFSRDEWPDFCAAALRKEP